MVREVSYDEIRDRIRTGDVIAFSGKGAFSGLIKWATKSPISHVGLALEAEALIKAGLSNKMLQILESTTLSKGGQKGVQLNFLRERVAEYNGNVYWLPLREDIRAKMDAESLFSFAVKQRGKPYDYAQALLTGLHIRTPFLQRFYYCSELVSAALTVAGVVPTSVSKEETPQQVCEWPIYEGCYQMTQQLEEIPNFNKGSF